MHPDAHLLEVGAGWIQPDPDPNPYPNPNPNPSPDPNPYPNPNPSPDPNPYPNPYPYPSINLAIVDTLSADALLGRRAALDDFAILGKVDARYWSG